MSNDTTPAFPLTREIPLTRGKVAIVDAEDYERVARYKWGAHCSRNKNVWYARHSFLVDGKWQTVQLHRFILNTPPGKETDHINGDGLDNRRANLRAASHSQNQHNANIPRHNTSGYKGVTCKRYAVSVRWTASIHEHGKCLHLGSYSSAEDAARAYDVKALELHGEFARLNFPREPING